jgi:hypothetical protein
LNSEVENKIIYRNISILVLRVGLVVLLVGTGWFFYKQLPAHSESDVDASQTSLQIVLRNGADAGATTLDVAIDLYPVDIVAVRHEFFTEPRPGKRFEDFLKDRMKGRSRINTRLDSQGHGTVVLSPGNWWLHAKLSGVEEVEWRLPLTITGQKQTIELTPQNAYTRSRSF